MSAPRRSRRRVRVAVARALLALLVALALLLSSRVGMGQVRASESDVKAAFLLKFAAYVEWPEDVLGERPGEFTIAVCGADTLAARLDALAVGRDVAGHRVAVRRSCARSDGAAPHLLFVGRDAEATVPALSDRLAGPATLVVSEQPGVLPHGSMINFVVEEGRVRFDVAPPRPEPGGLRISSRLLAVARRVEGRS